MDVGASFGAWLKRRRKVLDLTQEALAVKVGCSVATIQKIESDERRPSRQIADLLAQHLAIPPAECATFMKVARGELRVDRLADSAPTAVTTSPAPAPSSVSNLPIPPTPLIGREAELAALARLLSDPRCRLLTLVGPGGIARPAWRSRRLRPVTTCFATARTSFHWMASARGRSSPPRLHAPCISHFRAVSIRRRNCSIISRAGIFCLF